MFAWSGWYWKRWSEVGVVINERMGMNGKGDE